MVGFVDTAVLVDVIRGYPPAMQWLTTRTNTLRVCNHAYMEIIAGATNKSDQKYAIMILKQFELVFITQADMKWAIQQQLKYSLSNGVGLIDCLIASPCARLEVPLYTRNLKHFAPLLSDLAISPY